LPDLNIYTFDDLLRAAREQPAPQRLLFVFAGVALPDDSTPEQEQRFSAGTGGALLPLMCVDRTPDQLTTFSMLMEELRLVGPEWALVFVASLTGHGGRVPTSRRAEKPLQSMAESIQAGAHQSFIPFGTDGQPVRFE
jgi:hypothetical protein